ncbi:MAG: metallophosphoesterase, partial [Armatimonadota bacterium]
MHIIVALCLLVAAAAAGFLAGATVAAQRFRPPAGHPDLRKGPYLQNVTDTTITVCWQTRRPSPGKVRHRRPGGAVWQVANTTPRTLHQVQIVGLKPGTTYEYQVCSDAPLTGWLRFTTAKPRRRPFRFAVYGDNRMNVPVHYRVCKRILAARPDLVLHTGDLVDDGRREEQWDTFFAATRELTREVPMFVTLGNHEHESQQFFDLFVLPGNEVYYSFDYGDVHFVSLQNSGPDLTDREQQLAWLERDLQRHRAARFIVASMHRPPYRTGWGGDRPLEREVVVPILRKYGVDLV